MVETITQTRVERSYTGGTAIWQPDFRTSAASHKLREFVSVQPAPTVMEYHFAAIREHARNHHLSMLEVIAEYALDDLPVSVGNMIKDYLEEHKPKVKPGEVRYTGLFASGRSDLSARMEEIIYGADPFRDSDEGDDE